MVENLLAWLGSSVRSDICLRGVVPVPWHTYGLDFRCLGPFFNLPGDELWSGFAPDAYCDLGFGDGLEVRTRFDRSDSDEEREIQGSAQLKREVDDDSLV